MHTESTPQRSSRALVLAALAVALVLAAGGMVNRHLQAKEQRSSADQRAVPTVALLAPEQAGDIAPLEIQARIEPWARAPIYARVSGYLRRRSADIGDQVKAGQVLGEIDMPDLDQQLLQARAELELARSNLALAASTSQRWQAMLAVDAVSKQEADEKAGDLAARLSALNAMQANVNRVQALQRYTRLLAPFDGVVTTRNTDVGALTSVGGAPGEELFVVSDISKLRVYVSVPQRQVASVKKGGTASVSVPERPEQRFDAVVHSMSRAINASSGAMLVQLTVENKDGALLPGGYATVRFAAPRSGPALTVPPGALIIDARGVQVALVQGDNTVRLKAVTIARDLGHVVELAAGIAPGDRVIGNPPDGIASGDRVRIASAAKVVR